MSQRELDMEQSEGRLEGLPRRSEVAEMAGAVPPWRGSRVSVDAVQMGLGAGPGWVPGGSGVH